MADDTPKDLFGLVGTRLDDYDVERIVAAGGFGIVYFARHRALAQPVAIKVLKVPDSLQGDGRATFLQLFLDEAKTIASLKHPAIVGVLGYRVSPMPAGGDAPWMALEWVEGDTLAAHLARRQGQGGRDPRECLRLLEPVFDALAVAHARGIAHRDIKPANIMLPMGRTTGRFDVLARVLDFGIAKGMEADARAGSGQTETSSAFQAFSMPYASFEQVSGTRTGPWTDVHALGLILVEMLTDRAPFGRGDRGEQMLEVMASTRPTPARFGVDVGPWEPVLAKALALKPADRYPNAGEFLAALEANVPTTARQTLGSIPPTTIQSYQGDASRGGSTTAPVSTASLRVAAGGSSGRGRRGVIAAALVGVALLAAILVGVEISLQPPETTAPVATARPAGAVTVNAPVAIVQTRDAGVRAVANAPVAVAGSADGGTAGRSRPGDIHDPWAAADTAPGGDRHDATGAHHGRHRHGDHVIPQ